MHLEFELLEERRGFARTSVALESASPRPMRAVAMPLVHESRRERRQPPAGHEKWLVAEFRVEAPAIRLWASEAAMGGAA